MKHRAWSPEARAFALCALLGVALPFGVAADGDGLSDDEILGAPSGFVLRSLRLRTTYYEQDGRGYQSQAERSSTSTPGSERLLVQQPQFEVVATQGRLTHRLWVPVDIVSAASADALDATSRASLRNEAVNLDLASTYHAPPGTDGTLRAAVHIEEPFRSYQFGVGLAHSFAEDNAVIAASVNQSLDEFDRFDLVGTRLGRVFRASSNANLALTQLLSPTTVGYVGYGGTFQVGELSNTWNAVALDGGTLGPEYLPRSRGRHALLARVAQALPWDAAVHGAYRFYADSWQIRAHTFETEWFQRLGRVLYLRATYRFHSQNAPPFWTLQAPEDALLRTSDSDLAELRAHTLGGAVAIDIARLSGLALLHADIGYERYFRSNDLHVNVYTCAVGFGF